MRFARPRRRPKGESIIPMINVVFLLLIFFLMTARIVPPEPFAVELPEAAVETPAEGQSILHISAEGDLAFGGAQGEEAVLAALAGFDPDEPLMLRADKTVQGAVIATLLPKLASVGIRQVKLVSATR
ncbi:ExbD/TolR family protein [Phaeobacter marinintestinus]|uniref:ExbD/TolR family protein n=1 Tax=Falsiphaeobacter marinintestinus TaxID=1492905 RepID=UPI0011B79F3A|nr:biopolymer transporter ExbD [Phaeobacter marinintestinus]